MSDTHVGAEPGSHAVDITRSFAAPREAVFRAWTDPDLVARWLGPRRLTMRIERWEVTDGGRWRFVHVDPDGTEFGFHGVFHGTPDVDRGVTWTFEFEGAPGHVSLETVTFTADGDRTTVHAHVVHQSVEGRDAMIASGMEDGMEQGFEQLDALLAGSPATV